MKEQNFYGKDGYAKALEFEAQKKAEGYQTCLIGHPCYQTNTVRYWK